MGNYFNTFLFRRTRNKRLSVPVIVNGTGAIQQSVDYAYPAVLHLKGLMTIGDTPGKISSAQVAPDSSPINKAMYNIYTSIRSKNSSISSYVPADVMKYLLAISSVEVELIRIVRDLGLMVYVDTFNAANPSAILASFDAEYSYDTVNTLANLANILESLEITIAKFKKFGTLPKWIYAERAKTLAQTIYLDEEDKEVATLIIPHISGFRWRINADDELVGALTYLDISENFKNLSIIKRIKFLDDLISSYSVDDDVNNLSAEIIKAYDTYAGSDLTIPKDREALISALKFSCDINMLEQVRNASIYGLDFSTTSYTYGVQENNRGELVNYIDNSTNTGIGVWPISFTGTQNTANYIAANTPEVVLYTASTNPSDSELVNTLCFKAIAKEKDLQSGWSKPCLRGFGITVLYELDAYSWVGYDLEDSGWKVNSFKTINLGSPNYDVQSFRSIDCLPDIYFLSVASSAGTFTGFSGMISGTTDVYTLVSAEQVQLAQSLITMSAFDLISLGNQGNKDYKSNNNRKSNNSSKNSRSKSKNQGSKGTDNK
nr:putative capsid [Marmot picobirnavirus]